MVQLVCLPLTELRIDRSFVSSALVSAESQEVVQTEVARGNHIETQLRSDEIAAWQASCSARGAQAAS